MPVVAPTVNLSLAIDRDSGVVPVCCLHTAFQVSSSLDDSCLLQATLHQTSKAQRMLRWQVAMPELCRGLSSRMQKRERCAEQSVGSWQMCSAKRCEIDMQSPAALSLPAEGCGV